MSQSITSGGTKYIESGLLDDDFPENCMLHPEKELLVDVLSDQSKAMTKREKATAFVMLLNVGTFMSSSDFYLKGKETSLPFQASPSSQSNI